MAVGYFVKLLMNPDNYQLCLFVKSCLLFEITTWATCLVKTYLGNVLTLPGRKFLLDLSTRNRSLKTVFSSFFP